MTTENVHTMDVDANVSKPVVDIAIIGAGLYGIQAARTYLELHPNDNVAIFDEGKNVGGVWSNDRVYDAFWTQTPLRILEFSDMPLEDVPESDKFHGFFPAKYVARYLKSYVEQKTYAGKSLATRITFESSVKSLEKTQAGWDLHVEHHGQRGLGRYIVSAGKVIDATGLTSRPNVPQFSGQETFPGKLLHSKEFASNQEFLLSSDKCQNVVVVGGAKSAADIAYACAKAGRNVDWIIRRSGCGPAAFVSAEGKGLYENSNESFYNRFTSHFLVSYFFDESTSWFGRFLYGTRLGQRLLHRVWNSINKAAWGNARYDRADIKDNGFCNLKPDIEIFWQVDSTGVCQHPDFFETILQHVRIHRQDVKGINQNGLKLADETMVCADAIVLATGWKMSHPEMRVSAGQENLALTLGLPVPEHEEDQPSKQRWHELHSTASEIILERFPLLREPPKQRQQTTNAQTPLRLYKGILPVNDNSIAFVGQVLLGNNFRAAEVQALYAVAALDGTFSPPPRVEMEDTIAQTIAWNRLRYLTKGQLGNWFYWDLVPYTDGLLQELGLQSHRHKTYWKDLFMPCFASDLRHILDEYRAKN